MEFIKGQVPCFSLCLLAIIISFLEVAFHFFSHEQMPCFVVETALVID